MTDDLHAVVERSEWGGWTWRLVDGSRTLRHYSPHGDGVITRWTARRKAKRALSDERYRRAVRADPQREEIR